MNCLAFVITFKCFNEKVYKSKLVVSYTGKDASQTNVEMLREDIREIVNIPNKEMIFGVLREAPHTSMAASRFEYNT